MLHTLESFKQQSASLSLGFILEMILLSEYSLLFLYYSYNLYKLLSKQKHTRSTILNTSLLFSTTIRVSLFLPPQVPAYNTITVIDMFTAPICYFTAISALLSEWYDVYVLSKWCYKINIKYMLIRRFTLTNLITNVFIWLFFIGTIVLAETFAKENLVEYLIIYDLSLSCLILVSLGAIGLKVKAKLLNLVDGSRTKFTNMICLTVCFTMLRFLTTLFIFTGFKWHDFFDDEEWVIFFFVNYSFVEIFSMLIVFKTERITFQLFDFSFAASSFRLSSIYGSSLSISNDMGGSASTVK